MNSGLQQLSHGDDGHWSSSSVLGSGSGGNGWNRAGSPAPPPVCFRRVGCRDAGILADAVPTLVRVHGVVRLPAWDLACRVRRGGTRLRAFLPLPGKRGLESPGASLAPSPPSSRRWRRRTIQAEPADSGLCPTSASASGYAPAEDRRPWLLVLGRVLERHGEAGARAGSSSVPGRVRRAVEPHEPADGGRRRRDPADRALEQPPAFLAELSPGVAPRASRYRAAVALVLFEVNCSGQPDDRGRVTAERSALHWREARAVRHDAAARVGCDEFAALLPRRPS